MRKKKSNPFEMKSEEDKNYELEYLRLENQKLKDEVERLNKSKIPKSLEKDIKVMLDISMRMRDLLQICRGYNLPFDLAKEIDRTIKEIENYG